MATSQQKPAQSPQKPASAPDATKTSLWGTLFGGGAVDSAAKDIRSAPGRREKEAGLKNGGAVKMTKSSTPHKCK